MTRLIVVDVRRASRLSAFPELVERARRGDPTLEVHVYDHHEAAADDLPASFVCVERVGSATTLLLERLRARGEALDAVEATLCALGIHADTGSLMFPATTARDVQAMAWLVEQGARLDVVQRYLNPPLTGSQRRALRHVLAETREELHGGLVVGFCAMVEEERSPGLDAVVSRALEFLGPAAIFFAHEISGRRVDVIGRSRTARIDAGGLLRSLGGGGHPGAGAATVKGRTADDCIRTLAAALTNEPPVSRLVRHVMSRSLHAVSPGTSLGDLASSLSRWGHTGAPVLGEDGALVGIVSRRDVRKAERRGDLHLAVRSLMSRRVRTIAPDATVEEALARMEEADIGRLPVVEGQRVVGIVTRTDVLAELYPAPGAAPLTW